MCNVWREQVKVSCRRSFAATILGVAPTNRHSRLDGMNIFQEFSWSQSFTRRRINVATKVMLLHSKTQIRRHLSGWSPRFWPVRQFRRPARSQSNKVNEAHTANILSQRLGEDGAAAASTAAWERQRGHPRMAMHIGSNAVTRDWPKRRLEARKLECPPRLGWRCHDRLDFQEFLFYNICSLRTQDIIMIY